MNKKNNKKKERQHKQMNKVLFPKEGFIPTQEIPGTGRWYLRAMIREEADGELILASEEILDHAPTEAEIAKANEAAEKEGLEMTHADNLDRIAALKQQLTDTDYKVIKNSEWRDTQIMTNGVTPALSDEGWPYDPQALYNEREAIRVEIRALEAVADSDTENTDNETVTNNNLSE